MSPRLRNADGALNGIKTVVEPLKKHEQCKKNPLGRQRLSLNKLQHRKIDEYFDVHPTISNRDIYKGRINNLVNDLNVLSTNGLNVTEKHILSRFSFKRLKKRKKRKNKLL